MTEEEVRKIVREEIELAMPQRDFRGYFPPAYAPQWQSRGCFVCGLGADGKPMAYVCSRNGCPTRATSGATPHDHP